MTTVSEQIWQILFDVDNTFLLVSRKILLAMVSNPSTPSNVWNGVEEGVQVPHTRILTTEEFRELSRVVNPLGHSDFHGVDLYLRTVAFPFERWSNRIPS